MEEVKAWDFALLCHLCWELHMRIIAQAADKEIIDNVAVVTFQKKTPVSLSILNGGFLQYMNDARGDYIVQCDNVKMLTSLTAAVKQYSLRFFQHL